MGLQGRFAGGSAERATSATSFARNAMGKVLAPIVLVSLSLLFSGGFHDWSHSS